MSKKLQEALATIEESRKRWEARQPKRHTIVCVEYMYRVDFLSSSYPYRDCICHA